MTIIIICILIYYLFSNNIFMLAFISGFSCFMCWVFHIFCSHLCFVAEEEDMNTLLLCALLVVLVFQCTAGINTPFQCQVRQVISVRLLTIAIHSRLVNNFISFIWCTIQTTIKVQTSAFEVYVSENTTQFFFLRN